jgi:hypothetical protein
MRRIAVLIAVVALLAIAGCSFPSLSRGSAVRFHGEATDPIGDTASVADARVARPADLVYAGVQVTNDALRLTVRFAPHSLDPATTGAMVLLDTDLDPNTGVPHPGLGADYVVSLHAGPAREATTCPTFPSNSSRFDSPTTTECSVAALLVLMIAHDITFGPHRSGNHDCLQRVRS